MKTKPTKSEPPADTTGNDNVLALHGSMAAKRITNIDNSTGKNETHNHNGYKLADLIKMLEERFQHLLEKDQQIESIWKENRILTAEVINQCQELRRYNLAYKKQADTISALNKRIEELTDKLLAKE